MQPADRNHRPCPICRRFPDHAEVYLEERIDTSALNSYSFASRKEPERLCFQMVRCPTCDLVYVDSPPSQGELAKAYHSADYDSSEEANDAASSYADAFAKVLGRLAHDSALEIGTGTGVFLEKLSAIGFRHVEGIEPSTAAIAAAPEHRRPWIREGIFVEGDYAPESFDMICCFMTLEHVRDPLEVVESAIRLLRPGGAFLSVTHDYRHPVNRMLGKRSPIVDIEHMQLFSRDSIRALFAQAGYVDIEANAFTNTYALSYWHRLMPLPAGLKRPMGRVLEGLRLNGVKLSINVGNTAAAGFKPKAHA
ncbi:MULTISPECIES: class I SAM-dependent methyltransferase [Dyella]|uniref:Class I SAM-dependent methyltransferase n=2 Tax=Dyella TaxID=231454 RepID=A0A4R0YQP8_9GAMM|nr:MULTISPECIES: class I SAM-dependent methyltransferase [Dyella]TBR36493.1 class I SAM-dependent methyltransferase [Dyella terrae]TCI08415.1 class I SAM-dependent methyltransferase [Dyella soli]